MFKLLLWGSATKLRSWFVLRTLSKEATSRVALQQHRLRRSWHIICCANRYKNVCYTCVCDLTSLHCRQAQRWQLLRMSRSQACVCTLCWGLMLPKSPRPLQKWVVLLKGHANIKLPNRKRYKHDDTNNIANLKNVKGGVI